MIEESPIIMQKPDCHVNDYSPKYLYHRTQTFQCTWLALFLMTLKVEKNYAREV